MTLTEKDLMRTREKLAEDAELMVKGVTGTWYRAQRSTQAAPEDTGRKDSADEARAPLRGSKLPDRYWEPTRTARTGETLWSSRPRSVAAFA